MTILNINGTKVKVSDDFMNLSSEDQNKAVDEIAASIGSKVGERKTSGPRGPDGMTTAERIAAAKAGTLAQPSDERLAAQDAIDQRGEPQAPWYDKVADVGAAAAMGLVRGVAGIPGIPGTLRDTKTAAVNKLGGMLGVPQSALDASNRATDATMTAVMPGVFPKGSPSGGEIIGAMSDATGGVTDFRGDTDAGKYAGTVAEFIPGTALLGGLSPSNLVRFGVVPGIASEAAGQATEGTGYEGAARFAAGLAGGIAGGIGSKIPPQGRVGLPADAGAKAAMAERGIQPSLGMRGKPAAMAAATMEKFLPSAHVVANDAARAVGQIQKAFGETVSKIGRVVSPTTAGAAMQKSMRGFVERFQTKASSLYDKVDALIPQAKPFAIDKFQTALAETKAAFAGNPAMAKKLGLNGWDEIAKEAAIKGAPWDAIKSLRTEIGSAIESKLGGPLADQATGNLKRLYAALTDDMAKAAATVGDEASNAWKRANSYYKAGGDRIDNALDGLIGKNPKEGPSAERAFEAFSAMAKADRSTSDVVRMQRIKSSMGKDAWGDVSASIIDRMGRAKAGAQNATGDAFSPTTFLTEWNNMSSAAKRLLVPENMRAEMQKLASIAERVKGANAERNFSNTGTVGGGLALGSALASAPMTTAAIMAGGYLTAKALTSPMVLKLLVSAIDKPVPISTIQALIDRAQPKENGKQ